MRPPRLGDTIAQERIVHDQRHDGTVLWAEVSVGETPASVFMRTTP